MRSNDFAVGSWVIYPSHGVGKLEKIEKITIDGSSIDMFVISFGKSGLTLKIPVTKAISAGLRHTMSKDDLNNVYDLFVNKYFSYKYFNLDNFKIFFAYKIVYKKDNTPTSATRTVYKCCNIEYIKYFNNTTKFIQNDYVKLVKKLNNK